jgi:hypothetical protein
LHPPTNLRASGQTSNSITLDWNLPSTTSNVQGFRVYRNNVIIGTVGTSITRFVDTGLTSSTNYTYHVVSFDSTGKEASSNTLTASTIATPITPPLGGLFYSVTGEGTTAQHLIVRNATGAVIPSGWNVVFNVTGGNASIEWPAAWASASAGGTINTTVTGAINSGTSFTPIRMGVSANTRISNLTVNGVSAVRE